MSDYPYAPLLLTPADSKGPYSSWVIESWHDDRWVTSCRFFGGISMHELMWSLRMHQESKLGAYRDDTYRLYNEDTGDYILADILL